MRKINIFSDTMNKLKVGDIILFQEYKSGKGSTFDVSKPIYAIYLGMDVYDMACVMKYIAVPKEFNTSQEILQQEHIEWSNFIDILGYWKGQPKLKNLLKAYRKYYKSNIIDSNQVKV